MPWRPTAPLPVAHGLPEMIQDRDLAAPRTERMPQGAMHEMKKFYYDTAGAANPGAMASLLKLVTPANVLFGTDFPPGGTSRDVAKALAELGLGLTDADLRAIDRDNAVRLLPRLAAS